MTPARRPTRVSDNPGPPRRRRPAPVTTQDDPASTQDRIFDAAVAEFAAHGFAGARVDRIAAAAGVNKAMLYYHFGSKQRLYRAVLQRLFTRLGDAMETIAARPEPAVARLAAFIETFTRLGLAERRIAPIMLREVAEGAANLDPDTIRLMVRLPMTMKAIVDEGVKAGQMRPVNPVLAYLSIVWPILVYLVSGPAREAIGRHTRIDLSGLGPDAFVLHMQDLTARMFDATPEPVTRPARRRSTEHAS